MKIYYGEFTLKKWIDLILSKNIIVPDFQRNYVWDKDKVRGLFETFKKDLYIPPVTIGRFAKFKDTNSKKDSKNDAEAKVEEIREISNYIIDGQQRLTSILLLYKEKFPSFTNKKIDKIKIQIYDNDKENGNEPDNEIVFKSLMDLVVAKNDNNKRMSISDESYSLKDEFKDCFSGNVEKEEFFNKKFLGFAYIVSEDDTNKADIQEAFSEIFRNINSQGVDLNLIESRKAYYYINDIYKEVFNYDGLDSLRIKLAGKNDLECAPDFVRYLSFLSQYNFEKRMFKDGNNDEILKKIAKNYKSSKREIENYYIDFIKESIKKPNLSDKNSKFLSMYEIFKRKEKNTDKDIGENIEYKLEKFKTIISFLKDEKLDNDSNKPVSALEFDGIIECDLFCFGLINKVIFENSNFNEYATRENILSIRKEIKRQLCDERKEYSKLNYKKSPNTISRIKSRMIESIRIWE